MAVCSVAIIIDTAYKSIAERTDECWSEGIRIVYCRGIAILEICVEIGAAAVELLRAEDKHVGGLVPRQSIELDKQMLFVADGMVDTCK